MNEELSFEGVSPNEKVEGNEGHITDEHIIHAAESAGLSIAALQAEIEEVGGVEGFKQWLDKKGNAHAVSLLLKRDFWEGLTTASMVGGYAGTGAAIMGTQPDAPQYTFIIPAVAAGFSAITYAIGKLKERALERKSNALNIKRKMVGIE